MSHDVVLMNICQFTSHESFTSLTEAKRQRSSISMPPLQRKKTKEMCFLSRNLFFARQTAVHLADVILRLLLIFFNLQTFGEGDDFRFDGSNKGKPQ